MHESMLPTSLENNHSTMEFYNQRDLRTKILSKMLQTLGDCESLRPCFTFVNQHIEGMVARPILSRP